MEAHVQLNVGTLLQLLLKYNFISVVLKIWLSFRFSYRIERFREWTLTMKALNV